MTEWLIRLGRIDRSLAGELASSSHYLVLDIRLPTAGSRLLPLLMGLLSLKRELGVWLWHYGLQHDRHHGLRGLSVLQPWCGRDRRRWCSHATPPGDRKAGAPLSSSGCIERVGEVIKNGTQQ
jgi:hypothetical protein